MSESFCVYFIRFQLFDSNCTLRILSKEINLCKQWRKEPNLFVSDGWSPLWSCTLALNSPRVPTLALNFISSVFLGIIWYKPAVCFWNGFQSTSRGSLVVEFGQMLLWELGKYPGMQTEMMSENAGTWDTSHPANRHLRSYVKCSCLNCQCQSLRVGHKYSAERPPRPSPCKCWDLYFLEIFTISWQLPLFLIR